MFSHILLVAGLLWSGGMVKALEDYNLFREGACDPMSLPNILIAQQPGAQPAFVDTLRYNSAGSKYHMYKMASPNPRYNEMIEADFYYDFCYTRNTTSTSPVAVGQGFGQTLATWDVTTPEGLYIEAIPRTHFPRSDTLRQRVTLTDNHSFSFLLNCWTGSNQRAWNVVSNTPNLSARARLMIEEHAAALGFNRKNFVFLRYDSCRRQKNLWDDLDLIRRGSGLDILNGLRWN